MFVCTFKFNKKTVVFALVMIALVLIGIVLLVGAHDHGGEEPVASPKPVTSVRSERSRVAYLAQYGWKVESPAQSCDTVVIPRVFSEVFEAYNELQKQQGFDLSEYCGLEAQLYTYKVLDHESGQEVVAQLYVRNNYVIAGDVHSTALDGFMTGVKPLSKGI